MTPEEQRNEKFDALLKKAEECGWNFAFGKYAYDEKRFVSLIKPSLILRGIYYETDIFYDPTDPVRSFLSNLKDHYNDFDPTEYAGERVENLEGYYDTLDPEEFDETSPPKKESLEFLKKAFYDDGRIVKELLRNLRETLSETFGVPLYPFTIGRIEKDGNGNDIITKGCTGNGICYKDWEAFHEFPQKPCYVPELTDTAYTREDFLELAEGNEDIAEFLFNNVDWQSPSTLLDESFREGEIHRCEMCGKLYLTDGDENAPCPDCRHEVTITMTESRTLQKTFSLDNREYSELMEENVVPNRCYEEFDFIGDKNAESEIYVEAEDGNNIVTF